jgi:hypothetical protein
MSHVRQQLIDFAHPREVQRLQSRQCAEGGAPFIRLKGACTAPRLDLQAAELAQCRAGAEAREGTGLKVRMSQSERL